MAKDSTLVLAYFDNEAAADGAVQALKGWDKASEDIKLGAIGILVKDEKGKVKTHKLGARAGGSGAKTGMILGVIAAILSGGITLLGGVIGGAVGGGVLGSFFHKGLKLSPDDLKNLNSELDAGHAAIGVMLDPSEVDSTSAKLAELGGRIETHEISGEAIDNAEQVAAEAGVATAEAASDAGAAASDAASAATDTTQGTTPSA